MKSTGITRRIDDLGRIVIPKEIRKNLRIKENEVLEIFIDNDEIILKKFSSFDDMEKILFQYINVLNDIILNNVLITNRDEVIACQENKKYDFLNKNIGNDISLILESRNSVLSNEEKSIELIEGKSFNVNYYVKPILSNGDLIGSIIIFGNKKIDEKSLIAIDIVTKLIINYIQ